jgi:2-polyprenyl-3-methyl-5-hydroxy-6-metoxy-1,4-benzoquinol methylase
VADASSPAGTRGASSTERACAICGSDRITLLFVKRGVEYRACRQCGFRFSLPDVNPNLTNTINDFEAAYLRYLEPDRSDAANFASLIAWMERFRPLRGARVLDVGAGSGKLVRHFLKYGAAAEGIEPSRALFERFLTGDPAFTCGMVDSVRSSGRRFDVITAFDVIEHVEQPSQFLADIATLLEPGGLFFVSTPDAASIMARAFGKHWHFYSSYHLSYFSPRTLRSAAARHRLTSVAVHHQGKLRSVGYVLRYAGEFVGVRSAPAWASKFDAWYLPINLFDVMHLCFRREAAVTGDPGDA